MEPGKVASMRKDNMDEKAETDMMQRIKANGSADSVNGTEDRWSVASQGQLQSVLTHLKWQRLERHAAGQLRWQIWHLKIGEDEFFQQPNGLEDDVVQHLGVPV